jgi:hypothetical protein
VKCVVVALVALIGCKGGKADPDTLAAAEKAKARDVSVELSRALDTLQTDHLILVDALDDVANAKDDTSRTRMLGMIGPHELIESHDLSNVAFEVGKLMASTAPDAARDLAAQADALIAARKASEAAFKAAIAAAASDPSAAQKAQREFEDAQFRAAGADGARAARAEGARKP